MIYALMICVFIIRFVHAGPFENAPNLVKIIKELSEPLTNAVKVDSIQPSFITMQYAI